MDTTYKAQLLLENTYKKPNIKTDHFKSAI